MSRGPRLTDDEIERAKQLRREGKSWREVGAELKRDYSGLRTALNLRGFHRERAALNDSFPQYARYP